MTRRSAAPPRTRSRRRAAWSGVCVLATLTLTLAMGVVGQSVSAATPSPAPSASAPRPRCPKKLVTGHMSHRRSPSCLCRPRFRPAGCVRTPPVAFRQLGSSRFPRFLLGSALRPAGLTYAGAPATGPASVYNGTQVALEKTDGTVFPDGQRVEVHHLRSHPSASVLSKYFNYPPPRALPGDKQILVGNGILQCTDPRARGSSCCLTRIAPG